MDMRPFYSGLRAVQQRHKCTNATIDDFVQTFSKYLPKSSRSGLHAFDKTVQKEAGIKILRLNGCIGCHKHVYLPDDCATHCPRLKKDGTVCGHARFDNKNKPFEVDDNN